jgi:hypothetical protein
MNLKRLDLVYFYRTLTFSKAFLHLQDMENKEIKLNVQLTEKDYLKFQSDHFSFFKSKKWWIYGGILLIILLFVNIYGYVVNGFAGVSLASFLPFLVMGAVLLFVFFSVKAKVKSSFKSDQTLQHPMEVIINNEGLIVNAYRGNTNPLWEDVYRYTITPDTIYIYTAENKSVIIPKRVFENETDLNSVTALLKDKIDLSRHKKQSSKTKYRSWMLSAVIIIVVLVYSFFGNSGERDKRAQASNLEYKKDYKGAIEIYSQLIVDNSDNASYYGHRAKCEIELTDYKMALIDCERAISLEPNGWAYYIYAYALYYDGRYTEACKAIHKSIETGYTKQDDGLCDPPEE